MSGPSDISAFLYYLIESDHSQKIFGPDFQSYGQFCTTFDEHFGSNLDVHNSWMQKGGKKTWSAADFQALYIACWVYKPMEKGTYFLRMTTSEASRVKEGYKTLPSRKSSHLNGRGRSAHKGWAFLKGYDELLVQWHETNGRTYLMLKAEGHTTGLGSLYPHLKSWNHKRKHGEGLMSNNDLHDLSKAENSPVLSRAAENFSKDYGKFLKELGKVRKNKNLASKKATTTVRDMLNALLKESKWTKAPNKEVRLMLEKLGTSGAPAIEGVFVHAGVKKQFLTFAKLFKEENRPDAVYERFFEEIHVNPAQLQTALRDFVSWDVPQSLKAQTQRRSAMGH
jgi:hypothetical protein